MTARRRLVAWMAAAALTVMLALAWAPTAGVASAPADASPTPTPSASPTPCASPSPSSQASPSPTPKSTCPPISPSASAAPTPTPRATAAPSASPGLGVIAPKQALPPGTGAVIRDPAIAAELSSVLSAPLHLEPPSLHHLDGPPSGSGSSAANPARPLDTGSHAAAGRHPSPVGPLLLVLLTLTAVLATLRLARRALRPRVAAAASVPVVGAIAVAALMLTGSGAVTSRAPVAASPTRAPATSVPAAAGSDVVVLSTFVRVEADVTARATAITQQESQITTLAGETPNGARTANLVSLLDRHHQAIAGYQASLQAEYQFFVAVARDATARIGLALATAEVPTAKAVVSYNLSVVQTQLRQEDAIAAAEAAAAQSKQQLSVFARAPKFSAPVGGVVSQGFGATTLALEPSVTYAGVFYEHFHTGIDIASPLDTPVGAAAPGRVLLAGSNRDPSGTLVGYGNYVVIDHGGGFVTLYGHLDQVVVATDQLVVRGQEIGLLGSTGWSTGPHLHFEIRRNGLYIDPEPLLGNAVRP